MLPMQGESSSLLRSSLTRSRAGKPWGIRERLLFVAFSGCLCLFVLLAKDIGSPHSHSFLKKDNVPLWRKSKSETLSHIDWPDPIQRCDYVVNVMESFVKSDDRDDIKAAFLAQAADPNTFYRATARIFWRDFGASSYANQSTHWTESNFESYWIEDLRIKGSNVSLKSLWTWTTGDLHLSNLGAWRNRHGDVVFSFNDFDEGAIYSFEIDVLRLAVSICNHAFTNGFTAKQTEKFIQTFAKKYVKSVIGYIGNEDASLFELTPQTARGKLKKFLKDVDEGKSNKKLMQKFTMIQDGRRRFIKGPAVDIPHNETRLAPVNKFVDTVIRAAISPTRYGATRIRLGWNVKSDWDDDFFTVLDIAERVGSGIGSYGVDRYYVLLKGTDNLLHDVDGAAIILDVKRQVPGAVLDVLDEEDRAWYDLLFANDAARVVAAQARLTSYTDPFLGWFLLPNQDGKETPFSVRQRSPWKDSFNVDDLTKKDDFVDFLSQVALGMYQGIFFLCLLCLCKYIAQRIRACLLATATAHTRGTVAKPPADFKNSIKALLGDKSIRKQWTRFLTGLAMSYRKQGKLDRDRCRYCQFMKYLKLYHATPVLMDYSCFKSHVDSLFGRVGDDP